MFTSRSCLLSGNCLSYVCGFYIGSFLMHIMELKHLQSWYNPLNYILAWRMGMKTNHGSHTYSVVLVNRNLECWMPDKTAPEFPLAYAERRWLLLLRGRYIFKLKKKQKNYIISHIQILHHLLLQLPPLKSCLSRDDLLKMSSIVKVKIRI